MDYKLSLLINYKNMEPIKMTRAEYQAKYGSAPTTSQPEPVRMTRAEYEAKYNSKPEQGFLKGVAKDIIKPFARFGTNLINAGQIALGKKETQPFSGDFLGEVKPVGQEGSFGQKLRDTVGSSLQVASNMPLTKGAGLSYQGLKTALKGGIKPALKQAVVPLAKEGAFGGGQYGLGKGLEEQESIPQALKSGAVGALTGAISAPVIGTALPLVGAGARGIKNKIAPSRDLMSSQLDSNIRNIFKGTTADIAKLDESAFKARKGLELLQKESPNIQIPDSNAPLGSKVTKPFDLKKSTPNELLSSVLELDKKIVTNARKATESARAKGVKIDTSSEVNLIKNAIKGGEVPKATGDRMLKQLENIGNDPVKIHDWVQDVNIKYGKKYQRGTIDDTMTGKLADDVAEQFRTKLDNIVDRKGYAEAFGNNQELKRMLVTVAKKANKGVDFGDISTDAGLDLGISLITGNPAYMARTVGSGLFKGIVSRIKNQSGLRSLRKAGALTKKLGTKEKLPSVETKKYVKKIPVKSLPSEFTKEVPTIPFGKKPKKIIRGERLPTINL